MTTEDLKTARDAYLACARLYEESTTPGDTAPHLEFSQQAKRRALTDVRAFIQQVEEKITPDLGRFMSYGQIGNDFWVARNSFGDCFLMLETAQAKRIQALAVGEFGECYAHIDGAGNNYILGE